MAKTYVFHVYRGPDKHERFELREEQLEAKHKKLLLGQLFQVWDNTPRDQQIQFTREIQKRLTEEVAEKLKSEFNKRAELDDRIDEIIKEWRIDRSVTKGKLFEMIRSVEKDYDYVTITVYSDIKLLVKIHDGVQTFN